MQLGELLLSFLEGIEANRLFLGFSLFAVVAAVGIENVAESARAAKREREREIAQAERLTTRIKDQTDRGEELLQALVTANQDLEARNNEMVIEINNRKKKQGIIQSLTTTTAQDPLADVDAPPPKSSSPTPENPEEAFSDPLSLNIGGANLFKRPDKKPAVNNQRIAQQLDEIDAMHKDAEAALADTFRILDESSLPRGPSK